MPLNLSRYLQRLGIQTQGQQPHLLDTIQPIVIAADLSKLVNHPLWCSYIVGASDAPTAATFAAFQCLTPNPLRANVIVSGASTGLFTIEIGAPPTPPPTLNSALAVTPQPFREGQVPEASWFSGDVAASGSGLLIPALNTSTTSNFPYEVYVPAGGWLHVIFGNLSATMRWAVIVDELPPDRV